MGKKNVIYVASWAVYRNGSAKFSPEDIEATYGTHFIYSFLGADSSGNVIHSDKWGDIDQGNISKFIALKLHNPSAKFMFSIGGSNLDGNILSSIASSSSTRAKFTRSVLNKINEFGFDGFDLDWEFPKSQDRNNFIQLCAELHRVLSSAGKVFSIAVASYPESVGASYDVSTVASYVDLINVMTYDMHGSWDGCNGMNAPLYSGSGSYTKFSVGSINWWQRQGAPSSKLVVGMAAFGRSFTLANPSNNGVGATIVGPGNGGPFLDQSGTLGYNEICHLMKSGGWTRVWESQQKVPYVYKHNQWVGYDDTESIQLKLQYVRNNNLGGAMWWTMDTDDVGFPLIRLAKRML